MNRYEIKKYDFRGLNISENDINTNIPKTMYGSYWLVTPRVVKSDNKEILFDHAVNILKRPEVYTGETNKKYYAWHNVNRERECSDILDSSMYTVSTSITDIYEVGQFGAGLADRNTWNDIIDDTLFVFDDTYNKSDGNAYTDEYNKIY